MHVMQMRRAHEAQVRSAERAQESEIGRHEGVELLVDVEDGQLRAGGVVEARLAQLVLARLRADSAVQADQGGRAVLHGVEEGCARAETVGDERGASGILGDERPFACRFRQDGEVEGLVLRRLRDVFLAFHRTRDAGRRRAGRDHEPVRGEELAEDRLIGDGIAAPLRDEDEGNRRRKRGGAGNRSHRPSEPPFHVVTGHLRARAQERSVLLDRGLDLLGRGGSELAREEGDVVAEGEVFLSAFFRGVPQRHLDGARLSFARARRILERGDFEPHGVLAPLRRCEKECCVDGDHAALDTASGRPFNRPQCVSTGGDSRQVLRSARGGQMAKLGGTFRIGGKLEVHRLGFGAMRLTGPGIWDAPADVAEAKRTLARVRELGIDFIDTADSYGPFVSEQLIAEILAPYRGIAIATKAGLTRHGPDIWRPLGRPEYLRQQVLLSLRHLKADSIDLWQLHRIDPKVPRDEQFSAIADMQREGLIRHVGLSEVTVEEIEAAGRHFEVATVQNLYNLVNRRSEDVLEHCEKRKIGFIPWYPLAAGSLSKTGGVLESLVRKLSATPSQLALAWLLRRSPVTLPIPGTSRVKHLEENAAAANVELSDDDFHALDALGREEWRATQRKEAVKARG